MLGLLWELFWEQHFSMSNVASVRLLGCRLLWSWQIDALPISDVVGDVSSVHDAVVTEQDLGGGTLHVLIADQATSLSS